MPDFDINTLLDTLEDIPSTPPPTDHITNFLESVGEFVITTVPALGSDTDVRREKTIGTVVVVVGALALLAPMVMPKKKRKYTRRKSTYKRRSYASRPRRRRTYRRRR